MVIIEEVWWINGRVENEFVSGMFLRLNEKKRKLGFFVVGDGYTVDDVWELSRFYNRFDHCLNQVNYLYYYQQLLISIVLALFQSLIIRSEIDRLYNSCDLLLDFLLHHHLFDV